ncbi:MAG TPA: SpoIIE family protein phosphatase [Chthoniobacteraceae bacterium]|jgi:sigma-B regulation protein RsbU (phosphoserine phosphatase)|nr:SpoIIE family protein phosphatase [Chthoniobacteraceae bacterium]
MPQPTESPVRILLVEDDTGDARLIHELLRDARSRFAIDHVRRLSEAVERLKQGGIDVVLSDLSLPDSQGIGTFQQLHAAAPHVPVIVLSGLDDETLAVETVERGAQDYLVKGRADTHLLVRSIRYALKRAAAERELAEERNLLRSVINNLLDSIYVKDARGVYRLDNLAHMRSIGAHRPEDVVGKTVFDFFPYDAAVRFQADDQAVIRTGKAIVNRQEAFSSGNGEKQWLSTTKVPLRNHEGQIIGIVGIGRDITERKRTEEQLAVYNEELREKNMQLEDDLDMASEVQQAFLPQQFPTFPGNAPGGESAIAFCSRYLPTGAVGGDFFHVLPLSDTEAGVFICDVMGHGVRAALVTAIQRALVEELSDLGDQPGEFLTHINRALLSILRRTRTPMFASAFYLYLNAATGEVRYANAGHPKPLQMRRAEGRVDILNANGARPGSALGVFEQAVYKTFSGHAAPGDLFLMFTDGIFEVEGPAGDYFDQQRLIASVERRLALPSEELIEAIVNETRAYSVRHQFGDDVCLVGVELLRLLAG